MRRSSPRPCSASAPAAASKPPRAHADGLLGTCAAAGLGRAATPCAPAAVDPGGRRERRGAGPSAAATASAFSAPVAISHTSSARVDRRQGQGEPDRRRFGAVPHRGHAARHAAGWPGKDRRHVAVLADAEQQQVEAAGARPRRPGRPAYRAAAASGSSPSGPSRPASGAPGPGRTAARPAARRGPGSRCGPGRPAGRNRSSPHHTSTRDQSTASRAGSAEHRGVDRGRAPAAGQHDRRGAAGGLGLGQPDHQPRRRPPGAAPPGRRGRRTVTSLMPVRRPGPGRARCAPACSAGPPDRSRRSPPPARPRTAGPRRAGAVPRRVGRRAAAG